MTTFPKHIREAISKILLLTCEKYPDVIQVGARLHITVFYDDPSPLIRGHLWLRYRTGSNPVTYGNCSRLNGLYRIDKIFDGSSGPYSYNISDDMGPWNTLFGFKNLMTFSKIDSPEIKDYLKYEVVKEKFTKCSVSIEPDKHPDLRDFIAQLITQSSIECRHISFSGKFLVGDSPNQAMDETIMNFDSMALMA